MNRTDLRGLLFAVALGIAPLAAGCVSHEPLPSDIARAPTPWSGPPLELSVGVLGVAIPGEKPWGVAAGVAQKSLVDVLRASRVVASVTDLAPPVSKRAAAVPAGTDVDILLRGELESFDLYSSYLWWALYAVLFAIPFAGTASVILVVLLGGPVASDHGKLALKVEALEARTGKLVGTYRGWFADLQPHTIWTAPSVNESIVSHPEIMFQKACSDVVQEIARDRFWLLRFRRRR